jgi:drug/metabolite transporter (DMT)-like permease
MRTSEGAKGAGFIRNINSNPYFWVIVCLISSSIEPIVVKIGYRSAITPFQLLFIKAIIGGIAIIPLTGRWRLFRMKDVKPFAIATVLFTVTSAFLLLALKYLSAVMVITIITTTPALVALINQRRGREHLQKSFWTGFFLCMAGILLTLEINRPGAFLMDLRGVLFVFASVFTSALYRTRMDDLTREFTPFTSSMYIFTLNAVLVTILFGPWVGSIPPATWPLGAAIGIAGAIANVGFLAALHLLGSTRISVIGILQRPLVIIAVAVILKESLTALQILGIILVLAGIQLASVRRKEARQEPSPEPEEGGEKWSEDIY